MKKFIPMVLTILVVLSLYRYYGAWEYTSKNLPEFFRLVLEHFFLVIVSMATAGSVGVGLGTSMTRKGFERFGAHIPTSRLAEQESCHHLVVGCLGDNHVIVIAHRQIKTEHLTTHGFTLFDRLLDIVRLLFDPFYPLLSQVHQHDIDGHDIPPFRN